MEIKISHHLQAFLKNNKLTYQKISKDIGLPTSTLFSWGQGGGLHLTHKNLLALEALRKRMGLSNISALLFGEQAKAEDTRKEFFINSLREVIRDEINKALGGKET